MKNLLKISILFVSGAFSIVAHAQQINIGDQCPDVTLSVINYKTPTVKISDFKGQLLIIDFWATWCGPCVGMIPRTDSLQKQFSGKVEILPVTDEVEKTVSTFYVGYNKSHHILPYTAIADKELHKLFKPNQFPQYIWIDQSGKVVAITDWEQVNFENIRKVLNKKAVTLQQKKLRYIVDYNKPMFSMATPITDSGGIKKLDFLPDSSTLYRSVLTGYRGPRYAATTHAFEDSTRISECNLPIIEMYKACVGKFQLPFLFNNRIKVETKDSLLVRCKLSGELAREWTRTHTYCYELIVPPSLSSKRTEIMTADLNRYFGITLGIEGVMEKRITKCMVLVRTTQDINFASTNTGKIEYDDTRYHYKNNGTYLGWIINALMLDQQNTNTPLVDGTNYAGKVNIELNCDMQDMKAVNQALEKYGLKFIEKDYPVDFIVIKDIGGS